MKKENISIENSIKEFGDNIQKLNNLKKTIEYEMKAIDQTFEKVQMETTKSYELKKWKIKKRRRRFKGKIKKWSYKN